MRPPHPVPHLRDYLRILTANWIVIVLATVVSAGAGYTATLLEKPKYAASVDMFAAVAGDAGVRAAYQNQLGANARMSTYGALVTSTRVLQGAIDAFKLPTTTSELGGAITVTLVPTSVVMHMTVTMSDGRRAVEAANAISASAARASQVVEATDNGPAAELVPVGPASEAQRVRTSILQALLTGAGLGLVLSCFAVLARELLRDRLRHRSQLNSFVEDVMSTKKQAGSQ